MCSLCGCIVWCCLPSCLPSLYVLSLGLCAFLSLGCHLSCLLIALLICFVFSCLVLSWVHPPPSPSTFTFHEVTMEGDNDISKWLQELDQTGGVSLIAILHYTSTSNYLFLWGVGVEFPTKNRYMTYLPAFQREYCGLQDIFGMP